MSQICNPKSRVLFLLKYRQLYSDVLYTDEVKQPYSYFSSGLLNSASQIVGMLKENHVETKLVQVIDNNFIDKEVHDYRPTDVIIEALFVVPSKFEILQKLHPHVRWIIRLHSDAAFASTEGVFTQWLMEYLQYKNLYIGVNSPRMLENLKSVVPYYKHDKLMFLPNYYSPSKNHIEGVKQYDDWFNVACPGAIRVLKNQYLQSVSAIKYAKENDLKLKFHINATRVEGNSDNVLKNIRALFKALDPQRFQLVELPWMTPVDFREYLINMDMVMQVSLNETFNIVSCDAIAVDTPIVVSKEVPWASRWTTVEDPNDINSIVHGMNVSALLGSVGVCLNKRSLKYYNKHTVKVWLKEFK